MACLLQSLPQIQLPATTSRRTLRNSASVDSSAGVSCGKRTLQVISGRNEDDYHATLRALNSRGRTPRKSLGQVSYKFSCHSKNPRFLCSFRWGVLSSIENRKNFLCSFFLILQHYMLNSSINEELAAAADVKVGDFVLEIGPGTGSLTNVLLNAGATVLAIEKVAICLTKRSLLLDLKVL